MESNIRIYQLKYLLKTDNYFILDLIVWQKNRMRVIEKLFLLPESHLMTQFHAQSQFAILVAIPLFRLQTR